MGLANLSCVCLSWWRRLGVQCRRLDYAMPKRRTDVAPLVPRRMCEDEVMTRRLIIPVQRLKSLRFERTEQSGKPLPLPNSYNLDKLVGRRPRNGSGVLGHLGSGKVVERRAQLQAGDSLSICGHLR